MHWGILFSGNVLCNLSVQIFACFLWQNWLFHFFAFWVQEAKWQMAIIIGSLFKCLRWSDLVQGQSWKLGTQSRSTRWVRDTVGLHCRSLESGSQLRNRSQGSGFCDLPLLHICCRHCGRNLIDFEKFTVIKEG